MWWANCNRMVVTKASVHNFVKTAHNLKTLVKSAHVRYWRYRGFIHYKVSEFGMGYTSCGQRMDERSYFLYFKGPNRAVLYKVPTGVRATMLPYTGAHRVQYVVFGTNLARLRGVAHSFAIAMSQGVTGIGGHFRVTLELRGLGYRVYVPNPRVIEFKLGFSHLVVFKLKGSCSARALGLKSRNFVVFAKELVEVTALAARIRKLRKINVYKGKGIFKKYFKYKKRESKRK